MEADHVAGAVLTLVLVLVLVACGRYGTTYEFVRTPVASGVCYRAVDEIFRTDGVLDEASWRNAASVRLEMSSDPPSRVRDYPGYLDVKWCWDDTYWHVAFIFHSPDINSAPDGRKDWRSWRDDQVEMLIDPNGDGIDYVGLEIMPHRYVLDYTSPSGQPSWRKKKKARGRNAWDFKGMTFGLAIDGTLDNRQDVDRQWVCEMAIPWSDFADVPGGARPGDGTVWRVNLLANDFLPPRGRQYIELMWSRCYDFHHPTYQFHVPTRFGSVTFSEEMAARGGQGPG